jgi:hypothetical protein
MTRLPRVGDTIRATIVPTQVDVGALVMLPGDEAGHLMAWPNADDHSERRSQIDFYNDH